MLQVSEISCQKRSYIFENSRYKYEDRWFQQQGQTHFPIHAVNISIVIIIIYWFSIFFFKEKVLGKIQDEIFYSIWFPWYSSSQCMISMPNEYLILILVANSRVGWCMFRIWIKLEKKTAENYSICLHLPHHSLIEMMVVH